jgi:hypothetical protein
MDTIIKNKPWVNELLKRNELQDIMLRSLYEFYLTGDNIQKILPIITSNSRISIRLLDWFVTNYSKKNNIIYELKNRNVDDDKYFNVFQQYKQKLKSFKKKLFDPFCRKQRILFHYDEKKFVQTTVGQLNFFMWAIRNDILSYVEINLKRITDDMNKYNKTITKKSKSESNVSDTTSSTETYKIKKFNTDDCKSSDIITTDTDKFRRKRHELSVNASKTINIHNYSIVLSFD